MCVIAHPIFTCDAKQLEEILKPTARQRRGTPAGAAMVSGFIFATKKEEGRAQGGSLADRIIWEGKVMPVILDMPNAEYHASTHLSSSGAKTIALQSLADFKYAERKETPALLIGSAAHTLTFEPHLVDTIWQWDGRRAGKDYNEFKESADAAGAIVLNTAEYDKVNRIAEAVRSNQAAAELLAGDLVCEASVFATDPDTKVDMRARPDGWRQDIACLLDLKTTIDPSPEGFAKQAANLGYHIQESFYRRVLELDGHEVDGFIFIAVGKEAPYKVGIYELDAESLMEGQMAVQYALEQYAIAQANNEWGYSYGELMTIRIPPYSFKFTEAN